MKKYALYLIGICALVLTSVFFVACDDKKKNSDTEGVNKLVGTWQYTDETYSYTVSFRSDNSGTMRYYDSFYDESYSSAFDYTYDESTDILKMHMNSDGSRYTAEYKVEWYNDNKVYLTVIYDGKEQEDWGPFIRISNEPEEENKPIPNPDDNYDNTKIRGTWELAETFGDYDQYIHTLTIVFKADNTGTMSSYDTYYEQTSTANLTYTYNPDTDNLKMKLYGDGGVAEFLNMKVSWYNSNKIDLYIYDSEGLIHEDYKMGPFIRK